MPWHIKSTSDTSAVMPSGDRKLLCTHTQKAYQTLYSMCHVAGNLTTVDCAGGQQRVQFQQYTSPPLTVQQIQQLQQLQAQQQQQLQARAAQAQGQPGRPPGPQRGPLFLVVTTIHHHSRVCAVLLHVTVMLAVTLHC